MNTEVHKKRLINYFLMALAAIVMIGVIMVYSSSYMYAKEKYGSSVYFVIRQVLFIMVSVAGCFVVAKSKYRFWYKYSYYLNIVASFFLALTFIPGLGTVVKGANRWIRVGPFSLQPGEFVKYTILLSSLLYFESFLKLDVKQRVKHGISLAFPMLLLILQPDFGTFSICFFVMALTCFVSSFPRKWFYSLTSTGIVLAGILLVSQPYRVRRLMAFLDPWKNAKGSGFQVIQSWIGFANGGFFGKGPGNSIEKLFYLPEAHNDFIFSVIGEEFGFFGIFLIILLFLSFIFCGLKIASKCVSPIAFKMITVLISTVGIQVFLNMGVVLGLLPTKGLNLPFISYGGSSLMANFFAIGLILSAAHEKEHVSSSSYDSGRSEISDKMRFQGVRKEVV